VLSDPAETSNGFGLLMDVLPTMQDVGKNRASRDWSRMLGEKVAIGGLKTATSPRQLRAADARKHSCCCEIKQHRHAEQTFLQQPYSVFAHVTSSTGNFYSGLGVKTGGLG